MVARADLKRLALAAIAATGLLSGAFLLGGLPPIGGAESVPGTVVFGSARGGDAEVPRRLGATPAVERLHRDGVTGDGVRVGVVDVTGFDTDHPAIGDRVVAARAFGWGNRLGGGDDDRHGTAVAVSVATVAPDAELALADADSLSTARDAIRWLVDRDVDVVVLPMNSLGVADGGRSPLARAAARARAAGVVVVAPTGNLGRSHWEGRLNRTAAGLHRFSGGVRNRLRPLHPSRRSTPGAVKLWLSWNGSAAADLDLELYRVTASGPERVAVSRRVSADGAGSDDARTEVVSESVRAGDHYVVVRLPDRSPADRAAPPRIELSSTTHALSQKRPNGSIAPPATAPGVLSVGAYDRERGSALPYSSRGPTAAGRPGIDVAAPVDGFAAWPGGRVPGTSAAAAYAGGVAALLLSVDPGLSPADVSRAVRETAADRGTVGPDPATGRGLLRPRAAVERVGGAVTGAAAVSTPGRGRSAVGTARTGRSIVRTGDRRATEARLVGDRSTEDRLIDDRSAWTRLTEDRSTEARLSASGSNDDRRILGPPLATPERAPAIPTRPLE